MKLHTKLDQAQVYAALSRAQQAGRVQPEVMFAQFEAAGSRSHRFGYKIQLGAEDGGGLPAGTVNQYGKRQKTRRVRNSGHNDYLRFAATWHEWGWFMAEVFAMDPEARWGDLKGWHYDGLDDFDSTTGYQFDLEGEAQVAADAVN